MPVSLLSLGVGGEVAVVGNLAPVTEKKEDIVVSRVAKEYPKYCLPPINPADGKSRYRSGSRIVSVEYPVIVDYDVTVPQLIEAGRFDGVDQSLMSVEMVAKPGVRVEVTIELVFFTRSLSTIEARERLGLLGFRPANLYELLALRARYLYALEYEVPIVALGCPDNDFLNRHIPCVFDKRYRYVGPGYAMIRSILGEDYYKASCAPKWERGARFAGVRS